MSRSAYPRILAMLLALGMLAGCGYKGPLYLPPAEDGAARTPAVQPSQLPQSNLP
ncbi:lipoprotein [Orrella sp. JC864]|uniref:LPS translocon maturation chaperone LptM n=1 Tax=Orrella sp. JC864 TaxID=3120298 RepID=UPI00300A1A3F